MSQFDVHRQRRSGPVSLLVDVQANFLSALTTRLVVPAYSLDKSRHPIARLNPKVMIDGLPHLLATHEMAAIQKRHLGETVANIAEERDRIIAAIDLLITGI